MKKQRNTKKRLRVLAALMAAAMCVTACGNEPASDMKTSVESDQTKESSVTSEADQQEMKNYWEMLDEVSDTSELPDWTGEKLEITVWDAAGTDAIFGKISEDNVTFKEIERVTGVVINAEDSFSNGGDSIDAKLPKLIASGEFPTLIKGYNISSQFHDLYENGYLADLTEYYENGSLDHLQHWLPVEELEELLYSKERAEDGSLFLIPSVNPFPFHLAVGYSVPELNAEYYNTYGTRPTHEGGLRSSECLYIRDDVLKAVRPEALTAAEIEDIYMANGKFTEEEIFDLKLKSTADFVELLRDIKEELASGDYVGLNGEAMEVTYGPNTDTDNWGWMVQLNPAIGGFMANYFTLLTEEGAADGTMFEWGFKSDIYVDYMKTLNGLVREDIISQNSLVDNAATFDEKKVNGHYAVLYGSGSSGIKTDEADWAYRPLWVDMKYDQTVEIQQLPTVEYYGIFKDSVPEEQMDQLIHYIDYMCSMVGINCVMYGPESAGLFTVDADGNRVYTDPQLEAAMVYGEDSKLPVKYGLHNLNMVEHTFKHGFICGTVLDWFMPSYKAKATMERKESDAFINFNPGTLPGKSLAENCIMADSSVNMYSIGLNVESIAEFWKARAGFEDQMKKVLVAMSDEEFDSQLKALWDYAEEFGLTDETLKEFNELLIKENYNAFKSAGFVD